MKRALGVCISILFACGIAWAEPVTVYDVSVEPDSSNKKVTVQYRLGETADGFATVAVNISSNAGESWSVPSSTFYPGSDVGSGIPTDGSLRTFIWDARADWNNKYSTQMMIRVNATASDIQSWVFFAAGNNLYRMNLDGTGVAVVSSGISGTANMVVDPISHKLYMTKWDSGAPILFYDVLTGGNTALLYNGPGHGGQGIAYDPAVSTFFVGRYYNGLFSLNENEAPSWQQVVSSTQLSPLHGLRGQTDLDPVNQHLYFRGSYNGGCDQCEGIWRVNYDGNGLTNIMAASSANAFSLDLAEGQMYFSDGPEMNLIKRANLDGSDVQTIHTLAAPYTCGVQMDLDIPNGKVYMYLWENTVNDAKKAIARMNMDGTQFEILWEGLNLGGAGGMALFLR